MVIRNDRLEGNLKQKQLLNLSPPTTTTSSSSDTEDNTNTPNTNTQESKFSLLIMNNGTTPGTEAALNSPYRLASSEEIESMDDETILNNVFQGLAGVKKHVSLKDLLNWDFVLDLMGEGALDEETLGEMMLDCGGNKKGLNLDGFDKLVDQLVSTCIYMYV